MKFDAKELSDQELVVLESTLRVQLAVAKHVRVQQITSAIGGALLTAGLSTLLSGPSIVCSTVLRKKCKRRYFATRRELFLRRVEVAPIQESVFAKRALALSIASGLTCCVLGVALDVLVDGAVLQVVAFFFGTAFEGHVTDRTTGFVHDNAAELVGRDQVYVIDEAPFTLFGTKGDPTAGAVAVADTNETTKTKTKSSKFRAKSLVDISRHFWKSASWSFSSAEMQEKIKGAKQKYRQRPSMHGSFNRSISEEQDDNDINNNRRNASDNWAFLFAQDHHEFRADTGTNTTDGEEREHETLFGCRMSTTTTLFGTNLDEFGTEEGEQVELVRSDTFALFGDCYVVRVRHASTIVSPRPQASLLETKRAPGDHYEDLFASEPAADDLVYGDVGGDTTVVHVIPCGEEDLSTSVVPDRPHQHYEKSLVFTGDEASCAFWDGIWHLDDDLDGDLGGDDQGDVEYGVEVWGFDDDEEEEDVKLYHHHASLEPEYSVEVWNYDDEEDDDGTSLFPRAPLSPPYPNYKRAVAVDEEVPYDAFSLFGSPHKRLDSVSTTKYHPQHLNEEEVDDLGPKGLFG